MPQKMDCRQLESYSKLRPTIEAATSSGSACAKTTLPHLHITHYQS
jgi:hypothetical protein